MIKDNKSLLIFSFIKIKCKKHEIKKIKFSSFESKKEMNLFLIKFFKNFSLLISVDKDNFVNSKVFLITLTGHL